MDLMDKSPVLVDEWTRFSKSGTYGDPTIASADKGEPIFEAARPLCASFANSRTVLAASERISTRIRRFPEAPAPLARQEGSAFLETRESIFVTAGGGTSLLGQVTGRTSQRVLKSPSREYAPVAAWCRRWFPEALGLGVAGARPDDASDRIARPLRPASRSRISRNRLAGLTNLRPASGIRGRPLLRGACDSRACPAQ